jgi:CRP-like cAMP-binding protein
MPDAHSPRQNHLLAALTTDEAERIFPCLELVAVPMGHVLHESGVHIRHAYFPTTAVVAKLYVTENGASAAIAMVGNDGLVGISLLMGDGITPTRAVVQAPGHAYRLSSKLLRDEFEQGGPTQRLLLRYTQAILTQIAQTAVCNRHHSLDQQLCRLLLLTFDRLPSTELVITQELLANLLGVRREGVTEAAGNLQRAGLIRCKRGHITLLDRAGMEARSCECYAVVRMEYQRLLPHTAAARASGRERGTAAFRRDGVSSVSG